MRLGVGIWGSYVSEAIPLSAALRIHMIQVVVRNSGSNRLDLMVEDFTVKAGMRWLIQGQAGRWSVGASKAGNIMLPQAQKT
jgi:hypothetical protein